MARIVFANCEFVKGSGATRRHETARRAVHESPLARDTKAPKPSVEARKRFAPFSKRRSKKEEGAKGRSKEEVVRSKCGRFVFFCGARRTQQGVGHHTYSLLLTTCSFLFIPYSLLLAPYSLHLTPLLFSLYFLSPFSFVVREARMCSLWQKSPTRGRTLARQEWEQHAGTAEKRIPHRILIFSWGACGDLGGCGIMRGE